MSRLLDGREIATIPVNLSATDTFWGSDMANPHSHTEDDRELPHLSLAHSRSESHASFSWGPFFSNTQHFESLDSGSNAADVPVLDPLSVMPLELSMEEFLQLGEEAFSAAGDRNAATAE
ncbi:hypothetical protein Purlil1_13241 [Purpureocillium lilacinum]|uniref:Uncharacterized protein n=1 Tax=Purpureocillium lilacinum TaxID=33203 RepID=A0ABR0BEM2_PURLI|nr:hypothetical protein Purlil1_13241 [Purpureocillium lilacinum]